jgi:general secretion pathway protein K
MALLITIMTMSVLIAVTVMFHKRSWHSFLVANNYKVMTQLKAIGESGIHIGQEILRQEGKKQKFDTLQDDWSTLEEGGFSSLFQGGKLELKIVDLSGRLQLNALVQTIGKGKKKGSNKGKENQEKNGLQDILFRLLLSGGFGIEEESKARAIVDSLVDWIDKDERESDSGAESSYYQALKEPYACRNGPVQYIEELLLVKGITPQLLFGEDKKKGLADFLTVYGTDGKININTADIALLKSFDVLISDELVKKLDSFRTDKENKDKLGNFDWYLGTGFWPGDIVINSKILTTQSSFFMIKSKGIHDSLYSMVTANVHRVNRKKIELLSKKVE